MNDMMYDALRQYEVHGDGVTTAVDVTPSGRVVRCTIPHSPIHNDNPIFVSIFNSNTSCFEISWRDFYVQHRKYPMVNLYPITISEISQGKFILERSVFATYQFIWIFPIDINGTLELFWSVNNTTTEPADAYTKNHQMDSILTGTPLQRFDRNDAYPLNPQNPRKFKYPLLNFCIPYVETEFKYNTAGVTTYLPVWPGSGSVEAARVWNISHPFNSSLIIGWQNATNTITNDIFANRFSYTSYKVVATLKTDADGYLKNFQYVYSPQPPFGASGSFSISGTTYYISNGTIFRIS